MPLELKPFIGLPAPKITISCELVRSGAVVETRYELKGEIGKIVMPDAKQRPERRDELWKKTCFELFLMERGKTGYREFNFSPGGGIGTPICLIAIARA